jgi:hypothetical protein
MSRRGVVSTRYRRVPPITRDELDQGRQHFSTDLRSSFLVRDHKAHALRAQLGSELRGQGSDHGFQVGLLEEALSGVVLGQHTVIDVLTV